MPLLLVEIQTADDGGIGGQQTAGHSSGAGVVEQQQVF